MKGPCKYILLLIVSFITNNLSPVNTQLTNNLTFVNLSVKDGLSQGTVNTIYQDRRGFMWFGTGDGLNRYDGYVFRTFKHIKGDTTSISNNIINCITEDSAGNLWVGTIDGLNCYNPVTESFKVYRHAPHNERGISNNHVKSLFVDENDVLWIGTDMYLNRFDKNTESFDIYDFDGTLANSRIFDIHKDASNDIWLATRKSGLIRFNPETFQYKQYLYDPDNPHSISTNHVYVIYEDSGNRLWFGTWEHGVNLYDRERDQFNRIPVKKDGTGLNNNQIRCIAENKDGKIWIGTFEGLNIYDQETQTFQYHLRHNNIPGSLSYNTINYIFRDNAGSMWLGTHGGGIDMYNYFFRQFNLIDPKLLSDHDYGFIGPLVEHDGIIWIGTEGGGLGCYDIKTKEYRYFDLYNPSRGALNSNTIKTLCVDRNNYLWIGTYAGGILTFDMKKKKVVNYYDSVEGINNNIVNDIFEDNNGNIWVGSNTVEGVHTKAYNSDKFSAGFEMQLDSKWVDFPWIRAICEPDTNELWFGSIYYGIFIYKDAKTTRRISASNSALSSDYISVIMEDSKGKIWIGTYGGGVNIYDPENGDIKSFTATDGLLNDNISSIVEDTFGTVWIGTVAGISKFNPEDGTFTNYSFNKNGFPIETLNLKSGLVASDGQLYFGGSNGLVHFHPQGISNNLYVPPVVLTRLSLDNKQVSLNDETGILEKSISATEGIVLQYNQTNAITLEFATLNYIFPENNQYMFYLEGYETGWNKPGFQRQVIYTNLPAGKYVLKIKASNNSGIWNEDCLNFSIQVLPPPWRTWWAYTLYVFLFIGLIYAIVYYFVSRTKLENDIHVKQMEKQTLEQVHQMRLNMFTNFSHELRTPLTLILNPVKMLLSEMEFPDVYKTSLQMVYKNANRMLALVNQLLDLRKQEAGKIKIKVKETDIVKFVREIIILFRELANSKQISLDLHTSKDKIMAWFDPSLMEKVFYNLLSNAVKNTPGCGAIEVDIRTKDKMLEITVTDTGKGIPEKDFENIFDAFFQVDEQQEEGSYGTGLGLHITRIVIQQHHGTINVKNKTGTGACFCITLPIGKDLFKEDEFAAVSHDYIVDSISAKEYTPDKSNEKVAIYKKNNPIILLVDDNAEIRQFMKSQLPEYITYEAENGATGWELAEKIIPDIVISDIMMPVMDGLELCAKIKNHVNTSHIPVILLTARTSILQVEEGMMTGADDYITKPFDAELLKIRIRNMIENRRKAKQAYLRNFAVGISAPKTETIDKAFMDRAYDYVKFNMSNPDLNIEEFGRQLHLSRTQLFRKVKALTGMSPSLFISTLRLKYAAELLLESSLTVSEIAYQVGFNNLSYFTSSFRKLYNITPTEYRQQKMQHN
ncbi:MAG: response regulator [Tannerellaceae bacterium]|jgi:signal transduction histidine kinase/ligand-binding sensor domain-containing protein/DNA-binding response OmpR family regulator|nr:response regulator [Tannerellaceae bacterium]